LLVTGTALLDGKLDVSFVNGFIPQRGDAFNILDWGARNGKFATLNLPTVPVFLGWDTFSIVALYWTENVIIGAINVLKMITCNPDMAAIYAFKFDKGGRTDGDLADKYASTARAALFAKEAF